MTRRILLSLLTALAANAQFVVVSNAIGGNNLNVIAPGMLATITDATGSGDFLLTGFFDPATSLAPRIVMSPARVFIRPPGALYGPVEAGVVSVRTGNLPAITFEVPPGLPAGAAEIYWQFGTAPYRFTSVRVVASSFYASPEVRMQNNDGTTSVSNLASPARPGQTIILTGSGLGSATTATATLAGLPARTIAAFHGPTSGYDTIRLEVPAGIVGCALPLLLTVGDSVSSNTLSVSPDGSPCPNPLSLSAAELKSLDAGAPLAAAQLDITSDLAVTSALSTSRQEAATISTYQTTATSLTPATPPTPGCTEATQTVAIYSQWFNLGAAAPPGLIRPPDLGPGLTLQGPSATWKLAGFDTSFSVTLPPPADVPLSTPATPLLNAGKWTLSTAGSADLAPASVTFNLPKPLLLNGPAIPVLRRNQEAVFTWDGTGFSTTATVALSLQGTAASGTAARQISCTATARAGTLSIPAALLAPFDPASLGGLRVSSGFDSPLSTTRLTLTSGLPLAVFVNYRSSDSRPVDFQ